MRDSQSLLEQLLGATTGPIGVDDVHAIIGTGREEKIGGLVAAIAARDPRRAIQALNEALAGGADPGGVLEQVLAALRDGLVASVGCGPESLIEGEALGVDLAAIGRQVGTETILAMLQIIDQALARMRTSGHAAVLAEMAIIRLAKLEDLESLTALVHGLADEKQAPAAEAAPRRPEPASREKKTTELTAAAPAATPERAALPTGAAPAQPVAPIVAASTDPLAIWLRGCETVGGLAADFAATAARARWNDDVLEVTMPAEATTAASFLRRPEVAAGIARVLAEMVGRPLRHTIVIEKSAPVHAADGPADTAPAAPRERPRSVASQSALVREAMDHPFVAKARTLFDAAIRKVEPPRADVAVPAAVVEGAAQDSAAVDTEGGDTDG
jgi:DNA polymerase III gamma/tau subunit